MKLSNLLTALALSLVAASPTFAQVGATFGKRPAPEGSKACERPEFFAKLNELPYVNTDVSPWNILEIKAKVGEPIAASSVLSNVACRRDRRPTTLRSVVPSKSSKLSKSRDQ